MLFVRGSGNCVQCDTPLRKSNFRVQLFEDPAIDKEVEIRKKVLKMYVCICYMCSKCDHCAVVAAAVRCSLSLRGSNVRSRNCAGY